MKKKLLTCLLLLMSACRENPSSQTKATIDPLATDFQLGRGINILSGRALGDCLLPMNPAPAFDIDGKEANFTISRIESSQDLMQHMGLSAKAKYFGENGANGKTTFTEQFSINRQSLYIAFSVRVTNPLYTASGASLKPEAIELYKSQGARSFREACGDEFVRSYISGGEFITVLEIHTKSESHKAEIDSQIRGSYGTYQGADNFAKNLETIINQNQTQLFVYQSGGNFQQLNLSAEALLNKALGYPDTITRLNSRPIVAYTAPYKTLLNFPAGPSAFDIAASEKLLNQLATDDLKLSDLLEDILYILNNENEYPSMTSAYRQTLQSTRDDIRSSLDRIRQSAETCVESGEDCQKPFYTIPALTLLPREEAPVSIPEGPKPSEENVCILWIDRDGVPHHKSKSDEGEKRTKSILPIGKSYSYKSGMVGKEYTRRKVKDGVQTLDLRLTTTLGYWEDRVIKEAIDYN